MKKLLLVAILYSIHLGAILAPVPVVYVANNQGNTVQPFRASNEVFGPAISVGTAPQAIAVTPDNTKAYVLNNGDNSVSVFSIATGAIITTITGIDNPFGIAMTPDGSHVYVTNLADSTVTVIQTSNNTISGTINVGNNPTGVAITPNGNYSYVANSGDGTVSYFPIPANTPVNTIAGIASALYLAITPDNNYVYVTQSTNNTVTPINISTPTSPIVGTAINIGDQAHGIGITPNNPFYAYVTNNSNPGFVYFFQTEITTPPVNSIGVGQNPVFIAMTSDGSDAFVTNNVSNSVTELNISTPASPSVVTTIPGFNTPQGLTIADKTLVVPEPYEGIRTLVAQMATVLNLNPTTQGVRELILEVAQFYIPAYPFAYVLNSGSNTVTPIDAQTNSTESDITVGSEPFGAVLSPDGTKAFIANASSNSISVINTANNTVIATISGSNTNLNNPTGLFPTVTLAKGATLPLSVL